MKKIKKIAVVMGGLSSEREISLDSGKGVLKALKNRGYRTKAIDLTHDISLFIRQLKLFKPDVVFNALHGQFGEDGCIQGLLNLMQISYTHSGVMASSIGMDKAQTRHIAKDLGIPVANGGLKTKEDLIKKMPHLPYVAKPNNDGSSIGVMMIKSKQDHLKLLKNWGNLPYRLIEEYIPGRELSAAVFNGKYLGSVELVPHAGFYDYKHKYSPGKTDHLIPAPLPPQQQRLLAKYAETMHAALGCRGVTRCDFRYDDSNKKKPRLVYDE